MLSAVPKSWFSRDYEFIANGAVVAKIDLSIFRERGTLTIHGQDFEFGRESLWAGTFFLRRAGATVVTAKKPSVFRRELQVKFGGRAFSLVVASFFGRRFLLREGGREVGSVAPAHMFTRKAIVDLPESLPLEVQVFMAWLVINIWQRNDSD